MGEHLNLGSDKILDHGDAEVSQNLRMVILDQTMALDQVEHCLGAVVDIAAAFVGHAQLDGDRDRPGVFFLAFVKLVQFCRG
jgi:hypothetical protein